MGEEPEEEQAASRALHRATKIKELQLQLKELQEEEAQLHSLHGSPWEKGLGGNVEEGNHDGEWDGQGGGEDKVEVAGKGNKEGEGNIEEEGKQEDEWDGQGGGEDKVEVACKGNREGEGEG